MTDPPAIDPDDPRTWPASARAFFEARRDAAATGTGTPLGRQLAAGIEQTGPIPFARFMDRALYDPGHGYYRAGRAVYARPGDFLTSPETHPLFARLVGRWVARALGDAGTDEPSVVEMGAGSGALAAGILGAPGIPARTSYVIVEPDRAAVERQRERLASWSGRIEWAADLAEIGDRSIDGVFVSNELVDAFPVHRVELDTEGNVRERYVAVSGETFVEMVPEEPPDPRLREYVDRLGFTPPAGVVFEVNLRITEWIAEVARILRRGRVLTIDYGGAARDLIGPEVPTGRLRACRGHVWAADPLSLPGLVDLTCDVDFDEVIAAGRAVGLEPVQLTSQHDFLADLGFADERASLATAPRDPSMPPATEADRLIDPAGLGGYRVLVQQPGTDITG